MTDNITTVVKGKLLITSGHYTVSSIFYQQRLIPVQGVVDDAQ